MAESITPFVSAVGAGIAAGVFSSAVIYWFGRRNIKVNMMKALDAESSRNKQIVQSNILFKKDFAESGANRRRSSFCHSIMMYGVRSSTMVYSILLTKLS